MPDRLLCDGFGDQPLVVRTERRSKPAVPAWNTPLFYLAINAQWWSHILGAIDVLTDCAAWDGNEDYIHAAQQEIEAVLAMATPVFNVNREWISFADTWTPGDGDSINTININANAMHNYFCRAATPADGNSWWFYAYLAAGYYGVDLLHRRSGSGGKVNITIDGSLPGITVDTYGTAAWNVKEGDSMVVAYDGLHWIRLEVTGKHASSSNYYIDCTLLQLLKYADL